MVKRFCGFAECLECNKEYLKKSNFQKYCVKCSTKRRNDRDKAVRKTKKEQIRIKNYAYKYFREKILERDKTCKSCKTNKNLQLHHLDYTQKNKKEFREIDAKKIILLCAKCHKRKHKGVKDE